MLLTYQDLYFTKQKKGHYYFKLSLYSIFSAPKNFNANLSNSINIQKVRLFDSNMKEVSSCK